MIKTMKQNSRYPTHCKYEDKLQEPMRTWGIHQTEHWYAYYAWVGPSAEFVLAAARHTCDACEAQKAGPIVSRSPNSFMFNDVVGLDLFFLNTHEKHTLPAMNIVCWGTGLQRVVPLRNQSGETLRTAYRNNWLRSYGKPRILVIDQQRSLRSDIFAEKVESD